MKKGQKSRRVPRVQAQSKAAKHVESHSPFQFFNGSARSALQFTSKPDFIRGMLWIGLSLIAVTLIIYWPALHYGFLSWDDPLYVTKNVEVRKGLTWDGFVWAFTTGHAANWHPLTWLSHMLDVQLYGKAAGLHHLTNILLHFANALLLFWALYRMTAARGASAMVAALFAVHPLHVESVAWIAERKDVLSTFFWMLTLHAYISYFRRPCFRRYLAVFILFALGLLSKPMLVTLPLVLLLLDLWPLGRVRLEAGQLLVWKRLIFEKIPLFLLAAASSVATIVAQSRGGAVTDFERLSLGAQVLNAVASYVLYLFKTIWPQGLAAFYPYESLSGWFVAGSLLALISVSVLSVYLARKHPYLLVGWLWYLGTLVPVIGIIQVGSQARADRYTYVPLIGIFMMVAWGIPAFLGQWRYRRATLQAAGILSICAFTAVARNQVRFWESDLALWEHAVQATGNNFFSRKLLGSALADRGDLAGAIAQYSESIRLNPRFADAHNALGAVFGKQGRLREAMDQYNEAIRLKPSLAESHSNRGAILWREGKKAEAMSEFRAASKLTPDSAEVHFSLGYALSDEGKIEEAIDQFNEALRINPEYVEAYNGLGMALEAQGNVNEAIAQYMKALTIKPDSAGVHNNLAVLLANQNRLQEAIHHFREALRLDPAFEDARINLATALEEQEKSRQATP